MDKQRIYDAMLIKAFRKDATLWDMMRWLKVYDITVPDKSLKRQPRYTKMRVQSFVGFYLKPLADRLWDTESTQDIKTLDWIKNLDCQDTSKNEIAKVRRDSISARRRAALIKMKEERHKSSNQWHVNK